MNELQSISFNELPNSVEGFSKLYSDYTSDFQKLQNYYAWDYRTLQNYGPHIERVSRQPRDRSTLVGVLSDQNRTFGGDDRTEENIRLLSEDRTLAIVTGQQVGILGGPLYTIYKTITAIKLARQLAEYYPDNRFIPVFWLEGEDHDYEEVNAINLLGPDHAPATLRYQPKSKSTAKNVGAVGEILLDDTFSLFIDEVQKTLQNSQFKSLLLEAIQQSYSPNTSFNKAFASWLNNLFRGEGLVFLSSGDTRLKRLLTPLFRKEIQEFPRVSQFIIERSAELEVRYHAQIKTKAMNLFLYHKGGRYLIEPREHDFSLKGTRHFMQKEELLKIAGETPELLSPNVALRPLCQDTLLPTLAYVAGPSEVAYFAQLKSVYQYFDLVMPVIYPRISATMVEMKAERTIEKYQLELKEFFHDSGSVNRKVVEMTSEVNLDEMFSSTIKRINDQLNEMKFGLNYLDPTLLGSLENTRAKIESYLQVLKEKSAAAQQRKHEVAIRQIERISNSILPNKNFQERELNILYFMNKYGMDVVQRLSDSLKIDQFRHQIVHL